MAGSFYIDDLIAECEAICDGSYGDEEQRRIDDLMGQLEGFATPLRVTGAGWIPKDKTRNGVLAAMGWLKANVANLTGNETAPTIVNNNRNLATASAAASATARTVQRSGLSQKEKDALELALSRMRTAAEEGDEEGFADKLSKALEIAKGAAGLVPAVVQAASAMMGAF